MSIFEKYRTEREIFIETYNSNRDRYIRAGDHFCKVVSSILESEASDTAIHSISYRVKDREGCLEKFDRKYRSDIESTGVDYKIINFITDLIGIRIVVYYSDDIDVIGEMISSQLNLIEKTDKIKDIEENDNIFGYRAKHFDVSMDIDRLSKPEYKIFDGLRFELQVRTVVQDSWSVLDHKIKYKKNIPHDMRRRISMLAALFEMADIQFQELRDRAKVLKDKTSVEGLIGESQVVAEKLDVFSFLTAIGAKSGDAELKPQSADDLLAQIKQCKPSLSLSDVHSAIENSGIVHSYAVANGINMGLLTNTRHCFYLYNREIFSKILFREYAARFDSWISDNIDHK